MTKTWLISGASRGLGLEITKAALAAGDNVVAGARKPTALMEALGSSYGSLLTVRLDVTDEADTAAAVVAAQEEFGGLDILVNNAGYGQLGFFEENTLADARAQIETNLFGTMNLTWAALSVMRPARSGRIFNISSLAGIRGSQTGSIYCASKFAVEGFSEAISAEVAPFGIKITLVEPGMFRTDFLDGASLRFGKRVVADYTELSAAAQQRFLAYSGLQPGDPAKLAAALVNLANETEPPLRFAAGSDAVSAIDVKISELKTELDQWRHLSISTDRSPESAEV